MPRFSRSLRRAGRGALFSLLGCLPLPALTAPSWRDSVEILYDGTQSPLPAAEVDAALRYAIAAWSARLGVDLQRSAEIPVPGYSPGRIIIRWVDSLEQIRNGAGLLGLASTRRWTWTETQTIAGAEIYLHIAPLQARGGGACLTHTMLHEMGHALGIGHLANADAVMHEGLGSCHHTLTAADIAAAPYPQHRCHAEVTSGFDIYIPTIDMGSRSYAARLKYAGGAWTVQAPREVPDQPECRDTRLEDGNLVLENVWSPDRIWDVELQPGPDGTWSLLYAL
ncbi:MAG: matrixin family metalloprotease [Pseudomonadota bacterium]|nr:matrixin family metalloprotease [Pseudomonadota bacterium]